MDLITDGIIFDVDGTFWDSTFVVEAAWRQALKDAGLGEYDVTAQTLKGLFGLPMYDILKAIMPDASDEDIEKVSPTVYEYEDRYLRETPPTPYEGLPEMIKALYGKIPMFVVSNCQAGYIELFCEKTGLGEYFEDHLCPGDTNMLKADNIKKIVNDYNLKAPIYVGDTIMDEKACNKAGVPFVFASYGFGTAENPVATIDKPMDLLKVVE